MPGGGTDTVQTSLASYTLGADVENLTYTGAGNFTGTGNALDNIITGGVGSDVLNGGDGNDILNGGLGADAMNGGAGNDTFVVDNVGDTVTEAVGGGTDLVQTSLASYVLAANVENLTYTGAGNFTGTGNALANTITGGGGNDVLNGGAGADQLVGEPATTLTLSMLPRTWWSRGRVAVRIPCRRRWPASPWVPMSRT